MTDSWEYARVYPEDDIAANRAKIDAINPTVFDSIPGLFAERVKRTPDGDAYLYHAAGVWHTLSWGQFGQKLSRWRKAFAAEGVAAGERVAIRLGNCVEWVLYDQAAMGRGLVVVPVYAEDRADNIAYIIEQTVESVEQWAEIKSEADGLNSLQRVVVLQKPAVKQQWADDLVIHIDEWLDRGNDAENAMVAVSKDQLATIVFTSGTTGKPKGVMLSHKNIMYNAYAGLQSIAVFPRDRMLSFLPLSHMFERTIGCYFNVIAGSSVAFNRSIPELLDDMAEVRPTILITVPRIFERAYSRIKTQVDEGSAIKKWLFEKAVKTGWQRFETSQGRADWTVAQVFAPLLDKLVGTKVRQRFGGNLRFVVSGGAPLAAKISKVFVSLGIDILQGYGLTESSPVLTVNTLARNKPDSIGLPLIGTELRIADNGELQAKGSAVMMGYWRNQEATEATMTEDGWLMTGDVASISAEGYISITGRIKEIIVMANGEKVPPADMESAICDEPVFEQAMIVGEGKPYLSAIIVLNKQNWQRLAAIKGFSTSGKAVESDPEAQEWVHSRVTELVDNFPGYANIHKVTLSFEPWTVEDGALTPTLKLKRPVLRQRFAADIDDMYSGH